MVRSSLFWHKIILAVLMAIVVSGCAGFVKHENPGAEDWQVPDSDSASAGKSGTASSGPSIYISQNWTVILDRKNVRPTQNADFFLPRKSEDIIVETLNESRLANVVRDRKVADYQFVFENQLEIESNFGNIYLSALTFFIVPQIGTSVHSVKLSVLDRDGVILREFKAGDTVKHVSQILLLPFTPFSSSSSAERTAYEGSLRLMFQELKKSKILSIKP